ncbi:MAG: GntR family transcriptional regulator [Geminicoccales bacterium]
MLERQGSVIASFANQIRRDISLGILPPGERLTIEKLRREHKISHPSVREALAQLVGEGYVSFEDQKGFRVIRESTEVLQDTTRVRAELECLAFQWSLERADTDWRASIAASHFALSEVEREIGADPVAYALEWDERNRNFHLALCGNCDSPNLLSLICRQYDLTRRYRLMAHGRSKPSTMRTSWIDRSAEEHAALHDAALAGDAKKGLDLLKSHINKASEQNVAVLLQMESRTG